MPNTPYIRRYKLADPFYTSARWRRARDARLRIDSYWCTRCRRTVATMVHHVIPREIAPELELDLDNLRSLCAACHAIMHPEKGEKTRKHAKRAEQTDGIRVYQPPRKEVRV